MVRGPSPTIQIFNKYVENKEGVIDASGIFTKPCYLEWLAIRKSYPKDPEHAFRKAVTGHCRGDCGLKPFSPEVEIAVLKILRRKQVWACFKDSKVKIGSRGFQTQGYWEMRDKGKRRNRESYESSAKLKVEESERLAVSTKRQKAETGPTALANLNQASVLNVVNPFLLNQTSPMMLQTLQNSAFQQALFGQQLGALIEPNPLIAQQLLAQQLAWQQYTLNALMYPQLS